MEMAEEIFENRSKKSIYQRILWMLTKFLRNKELSDCSPNFGLSP